ncbi:MAG TPA: O-antigen ligase family protein [Bacteroidota bacterium]
MQSVHSDEGFKTTAVQWPGRLTEFGLLVFAWTIPISHVPAQFGIGFAVLGWILEGTVNHHWQVRVNRVLWPLAFYMAWNIVCSVLSPRPLHSVLAVVDNEWAVFIMLMMFWTVRTPELLSRIMKGFLFSASVAMMYAIWQAFFGFELYRHMALDPMGRFYRAVGFYGFYLTFAAFAMTVFFLSTAQMLERRTTRRWFAAFLPVLSIAAILLTFARSIWLSLAGVIPFLGLVRGKKKDLIVTAALLGVIAVCIVWVPTLRLRAESVFDLKANETRINLWETSLKISHDFRIVGIGEDNFDFYFEKYKVPGYYDTTAHPHNDYLNVLINSGVPGLLLFLWMWFESLKAGILTWRKAVSPTTRSAALGGTLSLAGLMIAALFQDYYGSFINCLGWWFVVGLIFASVHILEDGSLQRD